MIAALPSIPDPAKPERTYTARVAQLNESSVRKYYMAYRDVDWDAPDHRLSLDDPRLCLRPDGPLGSSDWYRSLPDATRREFGLEFTCQTLRYGIAFESALSRGLLEFCGSLPDRSVDYRYALHEVIEESQHSLMFQEVINRSGLSPAPIPPIERFAMRLIALSGAWFPELFFFAVLTGEIFIDHENRLQVAQPDQHPLLRRILQIHITEEARHQRFAELYLAEHMPKLSRRRRAWLQRLAPSFMRDAQHALLVPGRRLVQRFQIPAATMRAAYGNGSVHRAQMTEIERRALALIA